ncbi:DnaD domain-containing protein [Fructilactobacillus sanfranciscensis]|uniref:DnaD domain-containing protein n=1 Tax=Fructilactobacillus sanfranciscensis TaxID=1625 RepID=UPI000CD41032|nr:DnaD domain protein [Fructilactobacillus sanfranciscensis]MCG7194211.1 DnaD domain protein [Fructilactobacillus sanfranciscensis]MCG7195516.1 DnaD domain protein [Fructilactobacillus sanfranciscensis]MDN4462284.1 DnaD domain protein [Fructilactobacillus sanfranciscensis]MVF16074.1 DnaD domain protein [Fructilactobacillus sanfranciscensis]NDR61268.1 DnaD domain protein [Fructilactobacillus sanfranciscensis]
MDNNLIKYLDYGSVNISGAILANINNLGLTATESVILIELSYLKTRGINFPEPQMIVDMTGFDTKLVFDTIHRLVKKRFVAITSGKENVDEYSFTPLNQKINQLLEQHPDSKIEVTDSIKDTEEESLSNRQELFNNFTQEFGRPLSPIELETINDWLTIDKYSTKIVKLALREAVLKQVYSLKYIDRILISWKKQNITTVAQVEEQRKNYEQQKNNSNNQSTDLPKIPIFKIKKE